MFCKLLISTPTLLLSALTDICTIVVLSDGPRCLKVVISHTENVFNLIFASHSTVTMNYMLSTKIYCAYPELRFALRNIVNLSSVGTPGWSTRDMAINVINIKRRDTRLMQILQSGRNIGTMYVQMNLCVRKCIGA